MRNSLTIALSVLVVTAAAATDALATKVFESGTLPVLSDVASYEPSDDAVLTGDYYFNTLPNNNPTTTIRSLEFYGYETYINDFGSTPTPQGFEIILGPTTLTNLQIQRTTVNAPIETDAGNLSYGPVERILVDFDPVQIGASSQVLIRGAGETFTAFNIAFADDALAGIQIDRYTTPDFSTTSTTTFGESPYFALYDTAQIPEPSSLTLLALGGLIARRRRRA